MSLLTPGSKSTEWKLTKAGIIIGAVFLFSGKFDLGFLTPENITAAADTITNKADDYLGAIMVLGSAAFYVAKRAMLKYQEMKQIAAIEIAKIQAETELALKLGTKPDSNSSGPTIS